MATNFRAEGDIVTKPDAGGTVTSGTLVITNELPGVALHDAVSGEPLELAIEGVWELPADNTIAINFGDRVFWDPGNNWVDKTATAQQAVGIAVEDKLSAGTTVKVKLGGYVPVGT